MAPFPDNLPPYGLDPITKILIYFGILYIISTAITTWLITRRRSFPKAVKVTEKASETSSSPTPEQMARGITETMSFDDTKDSLASLKIEIQGAEAALSQLQELKGELSPNAYEKLSDEYNSRVGELTAMMNDMLKSDIATTTGEIDEGISDDEMNAIEADLEKQLMDLDDDDFLVTRRPKKNIDEVLGSSPSQPSAPSTPQTTTKASQPTTPPPTTSQPSAAAPKPSGGEKKVPMPPPQQKRPTATPAATASSPAPQAPASTSSAAAPKPSGEEKKVPMPPPPKKGSVSAPPPPSSGGAKAPKATPPSAQQPKSNQPLSAAQPMKVETEDDDGMFAKSTSIAALRMDMLRELARLKKLIPEDQEKDQ